MKWLTFALPAVGVLATVAAAVWSIAQLVRSSSAYARHQQWSQIARDADNPKVRKYASVRAESYLLDHLAGEASFSDRLAATLGGLAFVAFNVWFVYVAWSGGARAKPFAYGGLHGLLLKDAVSRDAAGFFAVAGLVMVTVGPWQMLRSWKKQLAADLGLKTVPR